MKRGAPSHPLLAPRVTQLQNEDYRAARGVRTPPAELRLAATLVHSLFGADEVCEGHHAGERESGEGPAEAEGAGAGEVAWLQAQLPDIGGKRGEHAQAAIGAPVGLTARASPGSRAPGRAPRAGRSGATCPPLSWTRASSPPLAARRLPLALLRV